MQMVAEGVKTVAVVRELAAEYDVEMPIVDEVYRVVNEGQSAEQAYRGLLGRQVRREMHGLDRSS